ncbi:hypothetical protein [Pseudomonas plecoglossicida]|uniref:hypothetical protein n=1 Tax=Pseudomonas plecoglossicida TaxID=70775 RepID=UPI00048E52E8|nr:hypothetical protein [Pseudomonas plecoglossicida]GLR34713.1 hypothetical protein GCM10011247_01100 [Pseudomonas plecoglossicida]
MSKIIEAINVMISNHANIDQVYQGTYAGEVFFRYANKYKWSILKNDSGDYYLSYYSGRYELKDMASWPDEVWHDFNDMVSYNSKDLGTKEAKDSLRELHTLVKGKVFGMDSVLDEIIKSDGTW